MIGVTVADQQIDIPPTHTHQNNRHSGLRMKMRPNQDVRGDATKCMPSPRHSRTPEFIQSRQSASQSTVSF